MTTAERVRRIPLNRTHHYIDIENLVGCGRISRDQLLAAKAQFEQATQPGLADLTTVGCDMANALEVGRAFTGARIVCGYGRDGADLALLEAMREDLYSAQPSRHITLGSGDHIFATLLSSMAGQGFTTRVVGIQGHTSARLRIAAQHTTLLPDLTFPFERTA